MSKKVTKKIPDIEDTSLSNELNEERAIYFTKKTAAKDDLTSDQWASIEKSRQQIKNGQYKTLDQVKDHFAQWLTR